MIDGWIKLHRKLLDWEWYNDINTTRLFIHLLLTVSIKDDNWHGVHVPRGSRITSRATLADETNLSERQVRTALEHLIMTNEITKKTTGQYTLISVINYDSYQSEQRNDRPTTDRRSDQPNDQQSDQPNDQWSDQPNGGQKRLQSAIYDDSAEATDQRHVQQTTDKTTKRRPTTRPTNDQPNDQQSDQADNHQKRLQSAACGNSDKSERPTDRPTARPTNDQRSDHSIRREEEKNIYAADTRARASERESFCRKIESAFGKLTGKLVNGADARTIFALYEQCTDADLVTEAMKKSAAKFNPKYIGDKIQSFNYFVPAINDAIHDTGRCSHGEAGRSDGQAAVGSSAFTGEIRNGTPSGFSSD